MRSLWLLVLLAACSPKQDRAAACQVRVDTMSAHLASPRPVAEIRKGASPWLAAHLDDILPKPTAGERATASAEAMETLVTKAQCAELMRVFGDLAGEGGDKIAYLRAHVPPAVDTCKCSVSPEDLGGLLEAMFDEWK